MLKQFLYSACLVLIFSHFANANDLIKQELESSVQQDFATPFKSSQSKLCIDGTPANDREIIDYWVDLECSFCRIDEILLAQRTIQNICIVIRHAPSEGGDSLKKALSYEALHRNSANAANMFWSTILPKGSVSIPYNNALMESLQLIMMSPEEFNVLIDKITPVINDDILLAQNEIIYTPTFVIQGFRFPACDFSPEQLFKVITIAKLARQGKKNSLNEIINIISNGINNKPLL